MQGSWLADMAQARSQIIELRAQGVEVMLKGIAVLMTVNVASVQGTVKRP